MFRDSLRTGPQSAITPNGMRRRTVLHASEPSAWNQYQPTGGWPGYQQWLPMEQPAGTMPDAIELIDDLDQDSRAAARRMFTMTDVAAGQTLVHNGTHGMEFFCVVAGHVDVFADGVFVGTLGEGDFFGELALLPEVTGSAGIRQATVIARTPTRLAVCHRREFDHLMRTCTSAQRRVYDQARRIAVTDGAAT